MCPFFLELHHTLFHDVSHGLMWGNLMKDSVNGIRKSVRLKRQRNGGFRDHWYGQYRMDGKQRELNLNIRWRGIPPASGSLREPGDERFEASRKEAEKALAAHIEEERHKGRAEHLTERLIESKTGRPVEYARIVDMAEAWRRIGREAPASERYLKACDAIFKRFVDFMQSRNRPTVHLYEVTQEDAATFVAGIQGELSQKSVRDNIKILNNSFARFLPVGAKNPFEAFVGKRASSKSQTVHRKPFTPEELKALLDTSAHDDFMHPLITAAACTGMRRGDVCNLKWTAVDWKGSMLAVKASKTEAAVEIPIFKPLLSVLEDAKGNGSPFVFPAAAQMLETNPDGLTWRFKKIVAQALGGNSHTNRSTSIPAEEIEAEALAAINANMPEGNRRDRMENILRRYCAGASFREIVAATGYCKATVSNDLHKIEDMIDKRFLRVQSPSIKRAVREATQEKRGNGQRAASVRDWHALRATFVTLALAAGVPVELVRRVTGHTTVDVVLKHYFKPDREQFREALTDAMPGILTGGKQRRIKPANELATLAGKIADGKATEEDRDRFKKLAEKV